MNYKPLTIEKLKEFIEKYPEYSLGEVLYAILGSKVMKGKPDEASIGWLLDLNDKDIYTAIDKAILREQE
jgi:hypothetical protein